MPESVTPEELVELGLKAADAEMVSRRVSFYRASLSMAECWSVVSKDVLRPEHPFDAHLLVYSWIFSDWDQSDGPAPAWAPDAATAATTNIGCLMKAKGFSSFADLHRWSVTERAEFWGEMIRRLHIPIKREPVKVLELAGGVEHPEWLAGGQLNIADACFAGSPERLAITYQREGDVIRRVTLGELKGLTHRVANGLRDSGFEVGDAIAICMPMNIEAVAVYLGIIRAGCVAVSIADSFASEAIAVRNEIAGVRGIFTQDFVHRAGRFLPLYEKVREADSPRAIVLHADGSSDIQLRDGDINWRDFLGRDEAFESVPCSPENASNILFSSGTTGDPKAIPWSHTSPIRCITDAWLHHDVREGDVLCWPTNLGWMMGPWLIYASLANQASMALFDGAPTGREFGLFVQDSGVTMLGVVPSLVRAWRSSECMKALDWSQIKAFSSTGESSGAEDMLYLMHLAGYQPVIEYCGGTEIAGGYITGTMVQPASPGAFSTPAMGHSFVILDAEGRPSESGELFLVPPSLGLSLELLNGNHHEVYYAGTPTGPSGERLRRHGDQMEHLGGGYYRAQGRVDDTMNLGGIKVSSAEIERVLNQIEGVDETAAIAASETVGGPSALVVYCVLSSSKLADVGALKSQMQAAIRNQINPLFKISDVATVKALPRTASNKVMRRELRARYVGDARGD